MDLALVQENFGLIAEKIGTKVSIKGFTSTNTVDRELAIVEDPMEFDVLTFKNSPQLLLDHNYIKDKSGNKVAAGKVTKAIPAYIKGEDPNNSDNWAVYSICSDSFISVWPKEKSISLKEGSKGLFVVAEVTQPHAVELVLKGELGAFSWRGLALHEKSGKVTKIKSIDMVEISIVHTQAEKNSTFLKMSKNDPLHYSDIGFTDCKITSMKFNKKNYNIEDIQEYTKSLNTNTHTISENDDSYFLNIGDVLVDAADTFKFCSNEGLCVLATPKIKKKLSSSLIKGDILTTKYMEKAMGDTPKENSEVQNFLLVNLDEFKNHPGITIKELGQKSIDGSPVMIHAAVITGEVKQEETKSTEVLDAPAEVEAVEETVAETVEPVAESVETVEPAEEAVAETTAEETVEDAAEETVSEDKTDKVLELLEKMQESYSKLDEQVKGLESKFDKTTEDIQNSVEETLKSYAKKESQDARFEKIQRAFEVLGNQPTKQETREETQKSFETKETPKKETEQTPDIYKSALGGSIFNTQRGNK